MNFKAAVKILFLDFDGVINTWNILKSAEERTIEKLGPWPGPPSPDINSPSYPDDMDTWLDAIQHNPACSRWNDCLEENQLGTDHVERLNTIVEATGCLICISSSWRHGRSPTELAELLVAKGFKFPDNVIAKTGRSSSGYRGFEIRDWLLESQRKFDSLVVLEDDEDIKPFEDWWVRTSLTTGLTDSHVREAIRILNEPFRYSSL